MNTIVPVLTCATLLVTSAAAGTLGEAEIAQLRSEVASITRSFERGDTKALIDQTHGSLYELAGGREAFANATQQAMEQLLQTGAKFVHSEVGTPTQTYLAGDEEVCFVPRISIMEVQGKKAKSTTFMIAVRRLGSNEWKYLDGAGLRKHPDYLRRLLPKLESGVELPPNKVELL